MESQEKIKSVSFKSVIHKEGVNPYVDPPLGSARGLFARSGVIPVKVLLDGKAFKANLMPLGPKRTQAARGAHHRLYLNGTMRKAIGKDVGDRVSVDLISDSRPRSEPIPPAMAKALGKDRAMRAFFESLSPSRRKEVLRYLNRLKTPKAFERTLRKVLRYLKNPHSVRASSHVIVRSVSR